MLSGWKPGFTSIKRWKLRPNNPAPTSSISVRATCETMRKFRKRELERLVDFPRPALCKSSCNWRWDELSAGTSPRTNPAKSETVRGKRQDR